MNDFSISKCELMEMIKKMDLMEPWVKEADDELSWALDDQKNNHN